MFRILIVDDETPARSRLRKAVELVPNGTVVGEAVSGEDAIGKTEMLRPDVVLLDVEMPMGDGFSVVEALMKRGLHPEVIFVTAHDQFAIDAFNIGAVDYLLKPADFERTQIALDRAIQRLQLRSAGDRAQALQTMMDARRSQVEAQEDDAVPQLWIKDRGQRRRVAIPSIFSVEADRDYVLIQTKTSQYHVRGTIGEYEKRLAEHGFLRVHRSTIVNRSMVSALTAKGQSAFEVQLEDGRSLAVGRSYVRKAKSALTETTDIS